MNDSSQLESLISSARTLICVGGGGVGKTTSSAALAYLAASLGRRVLVLTIDPSQRLKTAMGLSETNLRVEINISESAHGRLFTEIIDSRKTFDEFVIRASGNSEIAKKLLSNRLYQELSTTLSGSQDFTALERLRSALQEPDIDLIVLDTPPTDHALSFLSSPEKFRRLFRESVLKWFRESSSGPSNILQKFLSAGTRQALRALELLTGHQFMSELREFLSAVSSFHDKLNSRVTEAENLLHSPNCHFAVITSIDQSRLAESRRLVAEISQLGARVSLLVMNRAFPEWTQPPMDLDSMAEPELSIRKYFAHRLKMAQDLNMADNFLTLPEFSQNISDLESVRRLANYLRAHVLKATDAPKTSGVQ